MCLYAYVCQDLEDETLGSLLRVLAMGMFLFGDMMGNIRFQQRADQVQNKVHVFGFIQGGH